MSNVIDSTFFWLPLFILIIGGLLLVQARHWTGSFKKAFKEIREIDQQGKKK